MSALAKTQQRKALEFVAQAKALEKKKSWFGGSNERNLEEAAEVYGQAANAYKVGGLLPEAGDVYTTVAQLYRDAPLANAAEAAKAYKQAGACLKKSNPAQAVASYESAISLLTDAGRLSQAAKLCKECAELYEQEEISHDDKSYVVLAIESLDQASELFTLEETHAAAATCRAKVAELCSAALDPPDLPRAASLYEQLGESSLASNLLKFNAKSYFLQSILCHLAASDAVGAEQAMARYEGLDYTFSESREGKFCVQLLEAVNGYDTEALATACFEYDRISKLDPWKTTMLVKVKRSIQQDDEEEEDVDLT